MAPLFASSSVLPTWREPNFPPKSILKSVASPSSGIVTVKTQSLREQAEWSTRRVPGCDHAGRRDVADPDRHARLVGDGDRGPRQVEEHGAEAGGIAGRTRPVVHARSCLDREIAGCEPGDRWGYRRRQGRGGCGRGRRSGTDGKAEGTSIVAAADAESRISGSPQLQSLWRPLLVGSVRPDVRSRQGRSAPSCRQRRAPASGGGLQVQGWRGWRTPRESRSGTRTRCGPAVHDRRPQPSDAGRGGPRAPIRTVTPGSHCRPLI